MNNSPRVLGQKPARVSYRGVKIWNEEVNKIKAVQEKVGVSLNKQALKYFKLLLGGDVLDYSQNTHMEKIVLSYISTPF